MCFGLAVPTEVEIAGVEPEARAYSDARHRRITAEVVARALAEPAGNVI